MRIVIEIEPNDGFTEHEAQAEMFFNAGVGDPDPLTGEEWCCMVGQAYHVTNFYTEA